MVSRREFLKVSAATGSAAFLATRARFLQRAMAQAIPMPGSSLPQFIMPLPLLSAAGGPMETIIAGASEIKLTMKEFRANVLPPGLPLPNGLAYDGTWVWGYRAGVTSDNPAGTYIGPVFVATRGTPTQVRFVNKLTADHIAWRDWTDQTLHWADPLNDEMNMCAHSIQPGLPPSPDCAGHYMGPIPAVPHLHGAETPPVLDGGPDAWFTSDGAHQGHAYYTQPGVAAAANESVYRYLNTQEAAMIWFHDHVLGATRLNVYAGLAGAYALIDPNLDLPTGLTPVGLQQGASGPVDFLVPLVIQDRSFDIKGQLLMPNVGINPEHPYWVPEFVGDTIVVNGVAWPFMNVEPRRYRFLIINGSNARTYELFMVNPVTKAMGPPIWQIGTDGGYLDMPVKIDPNVKPLDKLTIMPGERADIIIDFTGLDNQILILRNTGRTPYPKGASPQGTTLGQIMLFRVGAGPVADASYDPASGIPLRPNMVRLVNPAAGTLATGVTAQKTRQLTLNEVIGPGGPLEVLVNNTKWDGKRSDGSIRSDFTPVTVNGVTEYYSELPNEGETEVWEVINLTADAHPIHTHLTQFQLINRQNFNFNKYSKAYDAAFTGGVFVGGDGPPLSYTTANADGAVGGNPAITPYLQGPARPPNANEAGWKDTVIMFPGEVTRIAVRYAPTDKPINDPNLNFPFDPNALGHGYVWHCHIIDHEDNEMMRPYKVTAMSVTRDYEQGTDY
ncbi:MAG: multicopper oxidase domain-containing protein [Anaerolineales bacterium]|jgi:spore coat protein A